MRGVECLNKGGGNCWVRGVGISGLGAWECMG